MSTISTEQIGQRIYVTGNTFAIKDKLRAAGCHWDSDRRQWWIGAAKRAQIAALVAQPAPSEDEQKAARLARDCGNILGTAKHDGHSYYLVGEGQSERGAWVRLLFRDGSSTFFKPTAEVEVTKRYRQPMTLAKLQEFAERLRMEADESLPFVEECWECGAQYRTTGNVEDGNMGCRRCG